MKGRTMGYETSELAERNLARLEVERLASGYYNRIQPTAAAAGETALGGAGVEYDNPELLGD